MMATVMVRDFKKGDWVTEKNQCNQLVLSVNLRNEYPLHLGFYFGDMGNYYTHGDLVFVNEHLMTNVPMRKVIVKEPD